MSKRIGLALSGGGIRAAILHLGVLKFLAEQQQLSNVTNISTVSGASLVTALIYSVNNFIFPTNNEYLTKVLPEIENRVLKNDIQKTSLRLLPFSPTCWNNKPKIIAKAMKDLWGIDGSIQQLPDAPFWQIDTTNFETGKSFRIHILTI